MISDALFAAIQEVDRYLNDHTFDRVYQGATRDEILAVRTIMYRLQLRLDASPVSEKVKLFIEANCLLDEDAELTFPEIYKSYVGFCLAIGELSLTRKDFAARLAEVAPGVVRCLRRGRFILKGIKLKANSREAD